MMGHRVHLSTSSVFAGTLAFLLFPIHASAEALDFVCSWDNKAGISISVDTDELTAFRSDGGLSYKVMNITEKAVFLQLEMPDWYLVGVQVLERPAGDWHDIIVYDNGRVSAVANGTCIERQ